MSPTIPQASLLMIPEEEAQLWWAGKEMQMGKKLQDYVGRNEKTKIMVKIQKVCGAALAKHSNHSCLVKGYRSCGGIYHIGETGVSC